MFGKGKGKNSIPSRILATAILCVFIISAISIPIPAHALTHSVHVAYVTDFGTGICDTTGPGSGSSVLVNAVTGAAPAGCPAAVPHPYTTGANPFATVASGSPVTFTDISVAAVNAGGVGVLAPYDTVMSYEVCDIGSAANAPYMTALNTYLSTGLGKVLILDGDRCAPISAGSAIYTTFLFPFTSSNPGPSGFTGTLTFQEAEALPAVVSRNLAPGFVGPTDAVGDSNTFTSNAGGWCAAIKGTNGLGITGIQTGYASTGFGGLAIWNGFDQWFTFGANFPDAQMFDNMLDQPFNPDSLPCGVPVTGIKLTPVSASNPVGGSHTVTATVSDTSGTPIAGVTVTITVTAGPNAGKTGTCVTNASGQCSFTYTDTGGAGTDTIIATFMDATGGVHTSGPATKFWGSHGVPEFGAPATLMTAIALLAVTLLSRKLRPTVIATRP